MAEYSVLIIDDDLWMQRILSKTLQSYGFKKTYLASNGFDGIGKAVEFSPNLIILDILMPELSGHLTLRVLKSITLSKDIPVIMVSALSDVENLGRAVKSGTAGFISKPFTRGTVYEKLLDLYGKEKLDLIAKGEDISDSSSLGYMNEDAFSAISSAYAGGGSSDSSSDSDSGFKMPDFSAPQSDSPSTDSLSGKYDGAGGGEKTSIDSIKELLMKSKKS
jgi:CheY-like chemotaxis protein